MIRLRVVRASAATWRRSVVGTLKTGPRGGLRQDQPWDVLIARSLPLLVTGTGSFGGSTHLHDAAGVGVYASRVVWRRVGIGAAGGPRNQGVPSAPAAKAGLLGPGRPTWRPG